MKKIFISHSHSDYSIAKILSSALENDNRYVKSFLASRSGDIRPGADWYSSIKKAICEATHYVILLTPISNRSKWVWFEYGAAFMSEKEYYLLRISSLPISEISSPLNEKQILAIDDINDVKVFFEHLELNLPDPQKFVNDIESAKNSTLNHCTNEPVFEGIEYNGKYYAWDGPLISINDAESIPPEPGLEEHLKKMSIQVRYSNENHLRNDRTKGFYVLYATDKVKFKRKIMDRKQILIVRDDRKSTI